jgi:hypothetical protein
MSSSVAMRSLSDVNATIFRTDAAALLSAEHEARLIESTMAAPVRCSRNHDSMAREETPL